MMEQVSEPAITRGTTKVRILQLHPTGDTGAQDWVMAILHISYNWLQRHSIEVREVIHTIDQMSHRPFTEHMNKGVTVARLCITERINMQDHIRTAL